MQVERKIETVTVEKVVQVEEKKTTGYVLTLDEDEVLFLRGLVGNINSHNNGEIGQIASNIRTALYKNGIDVGTGEYLLSNSGIKFNYTDLATLRKAYIDYHKNI